MSTLPHTLSEAAERVAHHVTAPRMLVALGFAGALLALEQRFPKFQFRGTRASFLRRVGRNLGLAVVYRALALPLFLSPLFAAAAGVGWWTRGEALRGPLGWVLDFLLLDLLNYSLHVASHKVPILWRFHAVHHMDEHLDATTGFRQHFGEKTLTAAAKVALIVAVAMPASHVALIEAVGFLFGIFHHSNLRLPRSLDRLLGKVVASPGFHDIHHGRDVQYTDSNYGFVLSVWDRLFRTHSVSERPVGFTNGLDAHRDPSLLTLLGAPIAAARFPQSR